jgi:hypothetical protein
VAGQTGGRYFPAESATELATVLGQAVAAKVERRVIAKPGPGRLTVKGADLRGHVVTRADDGQKVAELGHTKDTVDLPSGIYNVTVGKAVWKSVEVKPGQTTVLEPALLEVKGASYRGHKVLEVETGQEQGSVSQSSSVIALLPGEYLVTFGEASWPVRLEPGKKLVLQPGILVVKGATIQGHKVFNAQGVEVGSVSATGNSIPLPPGDYEVALEGAREKVSLKEGLRVELEWK